MAKNFVSNKDVTVRMFRNNFLETCSRVHFIVPVLLFLPVVIYFLYSSVFEFHLSILQITGFFILGIAIWTLTEYILHRFLFHWELKSEFGKKVHFIVHGVHHDYPSDSKRLVMVPTLSIPLALAFYFLFKVILGGIFVAPFFSGFLLGYLFYDMTHYAIHHYNFKSKFWLSLKHHHMIHHYKDADNGYGVSSTFWDHVFRTTFSK